MPRYGRLHDVRHHRVTRLALPIGRGQRSGGHSRHDSCDKCNVVLCGRGAETARRIRKESVLVVPANPKHCLQRQPPRPSRCNGTSPLTSPSSSAGGRVVSRLSVVGRGSTRSPESSVLASGWTKIDAPEEPSSSSSGTDCTEPSPSSRLSQPQDSPIRGSVSMNWLTATTPNDREE
jgi:hypothetical protein